MSMNEIYTDLREIRDDVKKLIAAVATLKAQATAWGAIAGFVSSLTIVLVSWFLKRS